MSGIRRFFYVSTVLALAALVMTLMVCPDLLFARGISQYKDTISMSAPSIGSNHTLSFILDIDVAAGAYIDITPPDGFEIINDGTFSALRNVELIVNGTPRDVGLVQSGVNDVVTITPGTPGSIRFELNTTTGLDAGSAIELRIGNKTHLANGYSETFDTNTQSTSTTPADVPPIINSDTPGTYALQVDIHDGPDTTSAGFVFAVVEQVGIGPVDTTETVPPERFNGAPTGTLPGTTFSVELSVETDEFAICHYSTDPNVLYGDMTGEFETSYKVFHNIVVGVQINSVATFYVRCMDDELNINIDDYVIQFVVNARPTGVSNTEGSTTGNGTGSGNSGGGNGSGTGGTTGGSSGIAPSQGGSTGGGGSGGGGGGGGGGGSGSGAGGGFESTAGPYRSGDAQVTLSGFTSPRSTVSILVDGKIVTTVLATQAGAFTATINGIARGAYTFGIYSTDAAKVKSSTFSTSFTVTGARESALSNILIAPTILATPDPVNPGQTLTLSGYSVPNATITVENQKDGSSASLKQLTAQSTANGVWSISVDTNGFQTGTYKARARGALTTGQITNFSGYLMYGVGQSATKTLNSDLNRDGKVNLTDFSILLYWWNTDGGTSDPSADINGDKKVNLPDFSILLFNWTG